MKQADWPVGGIFYCEGRGLWECRGVVPGDPEIVVFWNDTLDQSLSLPMGSPRLEGMCLLECPIDQAVRSGAK